MESRKIISFGSSSYVISLPKAWVTENKLKKGDIVHVDDKKTELLVYPSVIKKDDEPKRTVILTDDKDLDYIRTKIVSSYLNGYDVIDIKGSKLEQDAPHIKAILRNLTGLEIIHQASDKISAKDLLNIGEINIGTLIRRMDNIVRSMVIDAIDSTNKDHYASIVERDMDLNRLAFLAFRVIKTALNDNALAKKLGLSNCDLLQNWIVVSRLEKIGDQQKRIARHLRAVSLHKKEKEELNKILSLVQNDYVDVMTSYYKKDLEAAYSIDNTNSTRMLVCKNYLETIRGDELVDVARTIDHLKSMRTDIKTIARAVMDGGVQ